MSSLSLRRKTLLLLLCAVLAAPWATAAPRRPQPPQTVQAIAPAPFDLLGRSWSFLKSLWSADGCFLDPLGRCVVKQTVDDGCGIDPLGRCK